MHTTTKRDDSTPPAQPTSDLPKLSQPAHRALRAAGIHSLADISQHSEAEIKQLHGIGPKAIKELRHALSEQGLSFAE